MGDFRNYPNEQLNDPEFTTKYVAMRPQHKAIQAVIAARLASNMTQKELAQKTVIHQSSISRIESSACSPTIDIPAHITAGLGKQLKIDLI